MNPYLSLAVICGDAGLPTLDRMLKSVIRRSNGPFVDEIVIGFNGNNDALAQARPLSFLTPEECEAVKVDVFTQKWTNDFAAARNETWKRCHGEWVMWLDSDDVLASAADVDGPDGLKAINAVMRQYNAPEMAPSNDPGGHFKDWLRDLPFQVNCVHGAYDYLIENERARIRVINRRIVRRETHVWMEKIHEQLIPCSTMGETVRPNLGLLVRHYPSQNERERLARNAGIIETLTNGDKGKDDKFHHDVATVAAGVGDWAATLTALDNAISSTQSPIDLYRYRMMKVTACHSSGQNMRALQEAVVAIGIEPQRPEAYFAAAECFYRATQWAACIAYYEMGAERPMTPMTVDFLVSRIAVPRVQAALSYCMLGEPAKGQKLAEEALREFPDNEGAAKAIERCRKDAAKKAAVDGALSLFEYALGQRDLLTAEAIKDAIKRSVALRGMPAIPRYQELEAALPLAADALMAALKAPAPGWTLEKMAVGETCNFYPTGGFLVDEAAAVDASAVDPDEMVVRIDKRDEGIMVAKAKCLDVKQGRTIIFFCPHGLVPWDPYWPETRGIGGSETSAIALAEELGRRGFRVLMFCPGGSDAPAADKRFVWKGLHQFDVRDWAPEDIIVSCRAPWILRKENLKTPVFVWHQDNGYGNPWVWGAEINRRSAGNLHVSAWARAQLLKELGDGVSSEGHHVIGNGIRKDWVLAFTEKPPERDPHKVIFASDPTRGLDTLLNCWPHVREAIPDAQLDIYCNFMLSQALMGGGAKATVPGLPQLATVAELASKCQGMGQMGVTYKGTVSQPKLTEAMMSAGVYAYPGGLMPEGFGVVLAQAQAAGMRVVFPRAGALPDVLPGGRYCTPPVNSEAAASEFLSALKAALTDSEQPGADGSTSDRISLSRQAYEMHGWEFVAQRFLEATGIRAIGSP